MKALAHVKVPWPVLKLGEPQAKVGEPGGEAELARVRQFGPRLRHVVHEEGLHQILHVTAYC